MTDTITVLESVDTTIPLTSCTVSDAMYVMNIESVQPMSGAFIFQQQGDTTVYDLLFADGFQPNYEAYQGYYTIKVTAEMEMAESSKSEKAEVKQLSASTSILVIIQDANDNYPTFKTSTISVPWQEGATTDSLTIFEVSDLDVTDPFNAKSISYTMANDYDGTFSLHPLTTTSNYGNVSVSIDKALDYEELISYTVAITATDGGGLTADATIIVSVQDIEDTAPFFRTVAPYSSISEDAAIGTSVLHVLAVDGDTGQNHPVDYFITDGDDDKLFTIEKEDDGTAVVKVNGVLDRDNGITLYTITILATEEDVDNPDIPHEETTTCTISLLDVNDCAPTFTQDQYTASVPENSPNTFVVTFEDNNQLTVSDNDSAEYAEFTVELNDPNGLFQISPLEGQTQKTFTISVLDNTNLDYEKYQQDVITVVTTDKNDASLTNTATVTISITDENDVPPTFTYITCPEFPEDVEKDEIICNVLAVDHDSEEYAGIRYGGSFGQLESSLSMDPISGNLTVILNDDQHGFDFEISDTYYITITARDADGTGQLVSVNTDLHITDVNDNPPIFQASSSTVSLTENEPDFYVPLTVQATDADSGENAHIIFSLTKGGDYFVIENNDPTDDEHTWTATISPTAPLDFESFPDCAGDDNCPIEIDVLADDGVFQVPYTITVLLMDANDEAPVFESDSYEADPIREDAAAGTSVYTVHATDADSSSMYTNIVYRLQNDEAANFVIDSGTGEISVAAGAKLDPDLYSGRKLSYNLTITADDGGYHEGDVENTCMVVVPIIDIDNKAPVFTSNGVYTVSIQENTTIDNVPFFTAEADDPDDPAKLQYGIDLSQSSALSYQGVTVPNPQLDSFFAIDEDSGALTIIALVDREVMATVILALTVYDENTEDAFESESTDTAKLTITVDDINDNPPDFSQSDYQGSVLENSVQALVTVDPGIIVTDLDEMFSKITYTIVSTDPDGADVTIDPDNANLVTGNVGFDYESATEVKVFIQAADNGDTQLVSTATVTISITNVNEYSPQFNETYYTFEIDENSLEFNDNAQVFATDGDDGDYGIVNYKLDPSSVGFSLFDIDSATGIMSVLEPGLDYEEESSYSLTVIAYDNPNDSPSKQNKNTALVIIDVQPLNDNLPVIKNLPNDDDVVVVDEDIEVDSIIFTIVASDKDLPENSPDSTLIFLIDDPNELFSIPDSSKGDVVVAKSLLNQGQQFYLNVTVEDNGKYPGPFSTSAILSIQITDANNNPPVVNDPEDGSTPASFSEGTYDDILPLFDVKYTDDDYDAENKDSDFSIVATCNTGGESTDLFTITNAYNHYTGLTTGTVNVQGDVQRIECSKYKLVVSATNTVVGKEGTQIGTATYYAEIEDVDEYPPTFPADQRPFSASFIEEATPDDTVRVTLPTPADADVVDGDEPIPIYCYVVGGDKGYESFLVENNDDGSECKLTSTDVLDRETQDAYSLIIVATESQVQPPPVDYNDYDPDNATQLLVTVSVTDINDNPPEFTDQYFYGGVSSDSGVGSTVLQLTATDVDISDVGQLRYSAGDMKVISDDGSMEGIPLDSLVVHEDGNVILEYSFIDTMQGYMELPVYVHDSNPDNVATATLQVYVVSEDQQILCSSTLNNTVFRGLSGDFADDFTDVVGAQVVVDAIKQHTQEGQTIIEQSDIYIHMVQMSNHKVMEVKDAMHLVDQHSTELYAEVFNKYSIYYIGAVVPYVEDDKFGLDFYILIAVCAALALACILILSVCICQNNKMSRKLKAATITAFASQNSGLNRVDVPGTNKHTYEGSNPVWNPAADSKPQIDVINDSYSETSDNVDIFKKEDFEGGLNNPSYEQRIENIFSEANLDEYPPAYMPTMEESEEQDAAIDQINDNFAFGARTSSNSEIPDFPLSDL